MRALLACLLIAACSRPTAVTQRPTGDAGDGGSGGTSGTGGTGATGGTGEAGSGPWTSREQGQIDPLFLSADESHVIYGVRRDGNAVGSLRVLFAGASEPLEIDPSALLVFPERWFVPPPPGVLPGTGGSLLAYTLDPGAGFTNPYPVDVATYDVVRGERIDLARRAIYGVSSFVPGSPDLLYVDTDRTLRRLSPGDSEGPPLLLGVVVRSPYFFSTSAAIAPGGAHVGVVTDDGLAVVDLRTRKVRALGPAQAPPVFSPDGARLTYHMGEPGEESLAVVDLATFASIPTPPARSVGLSPDLTQALALHGDRTSPGPAALVDLQTGTELSLGERVVSGGFTAGGNVVWVEEELAAGWRVRFRAIARGPVHEIDLSCRHPEPLQVDPAQRLAVYTRCNGEDRELVVRRMSDGADFSLGRRRVLLIDPAGRGLLLVTYEGQDQRLSTWDAQAGVLHERELVRPEMLLGEERVLAVRAGSAPEVLVLDPFDPGGVWTLGAGTPTTWAIGRRRAAFAEGERVTFLDLP